MYDLEPPKKTLRGEAVIAAKIFSSMKKLKKNDDNGKTL